ncbi:hypothetical protein ENBRE01_0386 [Enteropsectra breve]|nr:hypothetical protein ENBRE01_0386 [Enteropsectra breve]
MSFLEKLYKEQPLTINADIEAFVKNPQNIEEELSYLEALLARDFEKIEAVFISEILCQCLKKPVHFTKFVEILLKYMEKETSYKNSVFVLRLSSLIINTRFFIPLSFYLIKILEQAIAVTKTVSTKKSYNYDNLRLSSDDLITEELQMFVTGEAMMLIKRHCLMFSSQIGFPEFAFVVSNELRSKCKTGMFKEVIAGLIKQLTDRKNYIETERAKIKGESLSGKIIGEFEQGLDKWNITL